MSEWHNVSIADNQIVMVIPGNGLYRTNEETLTKVMKIHRLSSRIFLIKFLSWNFGEYIDSWQHLSVFQLMFIAADLGYDQEISAMEKKSILNNWNMWVAPVLKE